MKILIVTTSLLELKGITAHLGLSTSDDNIIHSFSFSDLSIDFMRCDPGIFSMSWLLTTQLMKQNYDLVINAGICGSFKDKYLPGSILRVRRDMFADIGVHAEGGFSDLFDLGLIRQDSHPFFEKFLFDSPGEYQKIFENLVTVKAVTVNQVPLEENIRGKLEKIYDPDIETMEGAAFFYVCAKMYANYVQLRAVSNYTDERDKSNWETNKALMNLGIFLKEMIHGF